MVKRTVNSLRTKACDLTALPLPTTPMPYVPIFKEGKLAKKAGHYANWEAVVRAIEASTAEAADKDAALAHVREQLGGVMPNAELADPSQLVHFGGQMQAAEWHARLLGSHASVRCVVIRAATGEVEDVEVPLDAQGKLAPGALLEGASTRVDLARSTYRVKRAQLVLHFGTEGSRPNPAASKRLRMPLKGDVIVGTLTRELCFVPRERYFDFSADEFERVFAPRKRAAAAAKDEEATVDDEEQQEDQSEDAEETSAPAEVAPQPKAKAKASKKPKL